jgi:hypothetical protein
MSENDADRARQRHKAPRAALAALWLPLIVAVVLFVADRI